MPTLRLRLIAPIAVASCIASIALTATLAGQSPGGAEYLATWMKRLRAEGEANPEDVLTVGAGDIVGASPPISAAFHDEPAVEIVSSLGLTLTAAGDHEFDEGVAELQRLQQRGCHPVDGCQDGDPFAGARIKSLAANVVDKTRHLPVRPIVSRS